MGDRRMGVSRVRDGVGNTLWGGKDGKVRTRVMVLAAVAALALLAPALARAGSVPTELLAQAQANPTQDFNVIVQTAGGSSSPAAQTITALTNDQRKVFNDAFQQAQQLQKRAADLARRANELAAQAQQAQAKAASSGRPQDVL